MPDNKRTYIVEGSPVDVDEKDVSVFIEKFPNAKEAKSFNLNGDTIDVDIEHVSDFSKKFPEAKPLYPEAEKKKDSPQSSRELPDGSQNYWYKTLDEAIVNTPPEKKKKPELPGATIQIEKPSSTRVVTAQDPLGIIKNKFIGTPKNTAEFNEKYGTDHTVVEMVTGTQAWRHPKDHPLSGEEQKDAGVVKELLQSTAAGLDVTAAMIVGMPQMLYNTFALPQNIIAEYTGAPIGVVQKENITTRAAKFYTDRAAEILKDQQAKYDKGIVEEFNTGDQKKATLQLANSLLQMLPPMMAMAGAGYAGASPAAVEIGGALGFGSQKYNEIQSMDLPETTKMSNALSNGMLMSIFNKWTVDKMTIPVAAALKTGGVEAAEKTAKQIFIDTYNQVFSKLTPVTKSVSSGLAFSATVFANNVMDKIQGVAPDKDLTEGLADSFLEGMALGIGHGTKILNRGRKEKITKLAQETDQVKNDLNKPDVPPDAPPGTPPASSPQVKDALMNVYNDKMEELNGELQKDQQEALKYTDEEKKQIDELSQNVEKNKSVINDPNVSPESKALVVAENDKLNAEIDAINKVAEKRKLKMFQGEDFINETGLQPGYYTDEQVKQAKDDRKNKPGIQGGVGEGEKPIEAEPDKSASREEAGTSGILQGEEKVTTPEEDQVAHDEHDKIEAEVKAEAEKKGVKLTDEEVSTVAGIHLNNEVPIADAIDLHEAHKEGFKQQAISGEKPKKERKPKEEPPRTVRRIKKELSQARTESRRKELKQELKIAQLQAREKNRGKVRKKMEFTPETPEDFIEEAAYGIDPAHSGYAPRTEKGVPVLDKQGRKIYPDINKNAYRTGRFQKEGGKNPTDIAKDLIEGNPMFEHMDEADLAQKIIDHALKYYNGIHHYLGEKKHFADEDARSLENLNRIAEEKMPDDFTDEEAAEYDNYISSIDEKVNSMSPEEIDRAYEQMLEDQLNEEEFLNPEEYEPRRKEEKDQRTPDQESGRESMAKGEFEKELDKGIEDAEAELKAAKKALNDKIAEFDKEAKDLFPDEKRKGEIFAKGAVSEEDVQKALKPYKDRVEVAQKELDELTSPRMREVAKQEDTKQVKIKGPGDGLGSRGVKPTIDNMISSKTTSSEPFNYHQRVKMILEKIGVPVAEKNLSKRFLGLFKHRSHNVRVQSLFDIFTASHETAHYISKEFSVGKKLRDKWAVDKTNPEKTLNRELRKALTDIYVEYYPGASKEHSLYLRVEEGIAVLTERYLFDPTDISNRYGILVDNFLKPTGKYYHPKFTELLDEMNNFVKDYSGLSPEEKMGSRIARGEEVLKQDNGFDAQQKVIFESVYVGEPLRRMDAIANAGLTDASAEIAHFRWLDRKAIVSNWVEGKGHAMTIDKNGNWVPIKASVNEYLNMIEGKEKEFDAYLVSRRAVGDVDYMNKLANELSQFLAAQDPDLPLSKEDADYVQELKDKLQRQQEIIANDQFDIQTATAVVNKYEGQFKKAVEVFDKLNNAVVDFAERTGLLTPEKAQEYKENETYASFQRLIYDDLIGDIPQGGNAQSTVSAFLGRKGSTLQIKSPVASQILLINETLSKGLQNQIWQRIAKLGDKEIEIARRFEKMETVRAVDPSGKISYPQDRDPKLIKVWNKGKRAYYKAAPELLAFAETMTPQQFETFTYMLRYASGVFSRLTTTANPLFPLVNVPVDTISAWMNTKTGFVPVWDQIKTLKDMGQYAVDYITHIEKVAKWYEKIKGVKIKDLQQEDLKMFDKYLALGGNRQTQASYYDITPEELITQTKGGTVARKIVKTFDDYTLGLLEIPSNFSEYMTRFAEFKRAKEQGYSDDVAMYLASQVSVPFQQTGKWGGQFGQSYIKAIPYFNATMQVGAKFLRTAKENPGKVGMVSGALLSTATGMAIASMAYADKDDQRLLAEQSPQELSKYIYLPNKMFGGKGFTRIRIPEQLGAITGMAYMAIIQGYGKTKYNMSDYIAAGTVGVPNQFNLTNPEQLPWAWTPQMIKPSLELTAGVRTYPELAPIVPVGLEDKIPEYQYTQYTSETAKLAGKLLGMSPMKIDHFAKEQFGQAPSILLNWGEAALTDKKLGGNNRLIKQEKDYVLRGRSYNDFYKYLGYWTKQNRSIKDMIAGKDRSLMELINIKNNYTNFNDMKDILSELRKVAKTREIPEPVKDLTFETLKSLNYGNNPLEARKKIDLLKVKLGL